jgi:hypothetical protein
MVDRELRALVIEMVHAILVNKHAVRVIHEANWRAEVHLWTEGLIVVARQWCSGWHIGLRVC